MSTQTRAEQLGAWLEARGLDLHEGDGWFSYGHRHEPGGRKWGGDTGLVHGFPDAFPDVDLLRIAEGEGTTLDAIKADLGWDGYSWEYAHEVDGITFPETRGQTPNRRRVVGPWQDHPREQG